MNSYFPNMCKFKVLLCEVCILSTIYSASNASKRQKTLNNFPFKWYQKEMVMRKSFSGTLGRTTQKVVISMMHMIMDDTCWQIHVGRCQSCVRVCTLNENAKHKYLCNKCCCKTHLWYSGKSN